MVRRQLRRDVGLAVTYDDGTPFGSPVGPKPERSVEELFAPAIDELERAPAESIVQDSARLLEKVVVGERFASIIEERTDRGWRLRPEVLYPDAGAAPPRWLTFFAESGSHLQMTVPTDGWTVLHSLVAKLASEGVDPEDPTISPTARAVLSRLESDGFLHPAPNGGAAVLGNSDLTFLGHNTVVVRTATTQVIIDPFLHPRSSRYPESYQPIQVDQLGRIDAVLITHSHPDHLDPATLLRFPPDTQLIVPRIDRETLLAVAIERRVRELGFTNVSAMDWWSETRVGDIKIHALPFHGEQPTDGERFHPEIRNHGNLYLTRTPTFSAVFLADSGRDGQGDARDVAFEARQRLGPVDVVFSGYRGWLLYPLQLLKSSVGRYALFVPPHMWTVRQHIMITADEALDIAEIFGARHLIPYADGGAPWYWEQGLGPRLDDHAEENPAFDPFPEQVIRAAQTRSEFRSGRSLASPVNVLLLRPGDSVDDVTGQADVVRTPGHTWPYRERLGESASPDILSG